MRHARLDHFFGNNRHEKRRQRSMARRRTRVLRRMCPTRADFDALVEYVAETDSDVVEKRLRRMAYAAVKAGRISESDAVLFECKFEGRKS